MNYYLGALSEQDPGALFLRWVNPTEFDKAKLEIIDYLKRQHSWDLVNPKLWALVGFDGGPVVEFLKSYIEIAGTRKESVTRENMEIFVGQLQRDYNEKTAHSREYLRALIALRAAGEIPDTIYKPWTHTRTEPYEALTPAVQKTFNKLIWVGLGVAVIYAVGPAIVKQVGARGSRRSRKGPAFQPYTLRM